MSEAPPVVTETGPLPENRPLLPPGSGYVVTHWRGGFSLGRSYWVNGVLISSVIRMVDMKLEQILRDLSTATGLLVSIVLISGLSLVTLWQFVGIWRSATRTATESGQRLWPGLAKGAVMLGCIGGYFTVSTMVVDIARTFNALREPDLAHYSLERLEGTDLIFVGALNDRSVEEVLEALEDPSIKILRINSHGGLIEPAIRLGRHIRDVGLPVMAEGRCVSACVIVLAASPFASLSPGTTVTFHRPAPVAEYSNPALRDRNSKYLQDTASIYEEFEVASWAIAEARRHVYWTPSWNDLINMNLISSVFEPDRGRFINARQYCESHADECSDV